MKKYCVATLLTLALGSVVLFPLQVFAGAEEDVAEAEREIELMEISSRISKATHERVRLAISQTKRGKEAIEFCEKAKRMIFGMSLQERFKEFSKTSPSTTYEEYIWNECLREGWPFKDVADRLYKTFWDEELIREINRRYSSTEEKERRALEAEIRKMSV